MEVAPFEHLMALYDSEGGPELEARVLSSPCGAPSRRMPLPYTPEQADAILKLIEHPTFTAALFRQELAALASLGWLRGSELARPRTALLQQVGRQLYDTLFPAGAVRTALNVALSQARRARLPLTLRLHFDRDAGYLARLPWELVHDGHSYLVQSGRLTLARYIAFKAPLTPLSIDGPLRVLVAVARPHDLATLDAQAEVEGLRRSLGALKGQHGLHVEVLAPPTTWRAFVDALGKAPYHIIHFDGHGDFGRRCPSCRRLASPTEKACNGRGRGGLPCGEVLSDSEPQGYLAFERQDGAADWRSAENLAAALFRNPAVRLAVLTACRSATVGHGVVFGGTAPALIGMGVPAVVAMQFEVPLYATVAFTESFYGALAEREPLSEAVARARSSLDDESWYRPALYLRGSGDARGVLFSKE